MGKQEGLAALELRVLRTVRKFDMLRRGERVLVAVSGGADSMALLFCLHNLRVRLNLRLTIAHFNHRLRGAEADGDEEFVRQAGANLGMEFLSESVDVKAMAAVAGKNLEETAREARYAFLERAAARAGADKIATGHNLDDQAETVIFRLLRGSGPGGLQGIRPVLRRRIVRPLLECSRSQILEYLAGHSAAYREDSSNLNLSFQRNRIRHELIPYIERHFNPRVAAVLAREAALARSAQEFLEQQAQPEYEGMRRLLPDGVALPATRLIALAPALRHQVAHLALRDAQGSPRRLETVHVESILRLCAPGQSGKRIELPGGLVAQRNLDLLELRKAQVSGETSYRYRLIWPGSCPVPEAGIELAVSFQGDGKERTPAGKDPPCARLNPDALPPELIIRSRLPGDRYGGPGHRKVKKMLLASRIPLPDRAALPMVVAGDRVVWIPGFKPAKSFRADPGSGRSVVIGVRRIGKKTE